LTDSGYKINPELVATGMHQACFLKSQLLN